MNNFLIEQKQMKNYIEEYLGMLMPCYEYEYDLGLYGFVGNNGIKITTLKKIENTIQEQSSEIKLKQLCKEIHFKFIKLLLNPFYDKKEFFQEKSPLRETFANSLITLVKQYQII
jgi:hypothetical protein